MKHLIYFHGFSARKRELFTLFFQLKINSKDKDIYICYTEQLVKKTNSQMK